MCESYSGEALSTQAGRDVLGGGLGALPHTPCVTCTQEVAMDSLDVCMFHWTGGSLLFSGPDLEAVSQVLSISNLCYQQLLVGAGVDKLGGGNVINAHVDVASG